MTTIPREKKTRDGIKTFTQSTFDPVSFWRPHAPLPPSLATRSPSKTHETHAQTFTYKRCLVFGGRFRAGKATVVERGKYVRSALTKLGPVRSALLWVRQLLAGDKRVTLTLTTSWRDLAKSSGFIWTGVSLMMFKQTQIWSLWMKFIMRRPSSSSILPINATKWLVYRNDLLLVCVTSGALDSTWTIDALCNERFPCDWNVNSVCPIVAYLLNFCLE